MQLQDFPVGRRGGQQGGTVEQVVRTHVVLEDDGGGAAGTPGGAHGAQVRSADGQLGAGVDERLTYGHRRQGLGRDRLDARVDDPGARQEIAGQRPTLQVGLAVDPEMG